MIYLTEPRNFNAQITVATCAIIHKDETLLLFRTPKGFQGNKWGMPGGKLNTNETIMECVVRETFEETGIILKQESIKYFRQFWVNTSGNKFYYHLFYIEFESKPLITINTNEHTDYKWIQIHKIFDENLVSDHPAVMKEFIKHYKSQDE